MALGIIPSLFRVLNSVKNKIKNYFACNKVRKFYLFFYSAVFIVHLFLPLNWGDDAIFFEKSSLLSLKEFLSGSARPIIDTFTYFFHEIPVTVENNQPLHSDCRITDFIKVFASKKQLFKDRNIKPRIALSVNNCC